MDAFEQLASELFFREGYWVQNSVKVDLTKEEKVAIGRPSSPRWEIDLVAYSGGRNELLALECKSFLDSSGVAVSELDPDSKSTRYKLFKEAKTRQIVLNRLGSDLRAKDFIAADCSINFGLVAAKVKADNFEPLQALFAEKQWRLFGPDWLKERTTALAKSRYSNDISAVVAKILLR